MFSVQSVGRGSGVRSGHAPRSLACSSPSSFIQLFLPFESSKRVSLYYPCSTLEQYIHPLCDGVSLVQAVIEKSAVECIAMESE